MKRSFIYSLLTTVTFFSLISNGFCGKTDLEKFSDAEKFEYYSAKMKKHENDKEKAAIFYTKSLPFFPAYLQKSANMIMHQEAMEDYRNGKIEAAISTLESLAVENHPESLVSLARAYLLQDHFPGRLEKVITLLERASYLFHREADVQLGNLHFVMGKVIKRQAKTEMDEKQAQAHFTMSLAAYEKAAKRGHAELKNRWEKLGLSKKARPSAAVVSGNFGLPLEVMEHIRQYLTVTDLQAFSNTSHAARDVILDGSKEYIHHFMMNNQRINGLKFPDLVRASRLVRKSSEELPYKDWIHRCPAEKRNALIPTLELLDIFVAYTRSVYPQRPVYQTSRQFIEREFLGEGFSPGLIWVSNQNYKKLMPYHVGLLRKFPEILNIICFDAFQEFLVTKSTIFNELVYLTQEECAWIAGIIPPKGTKTQNILREEQRLVAIFIPAAHIIQFLASHEKEESRFKTLRSFYEMIPEKVGWDRFNVLGLYVAHDLIKIGNDLETRKLYFDTFSSLFTQFSSQEECEARDLANLLSLNCNPPIYKIYLEKVKQILKSEEDLEKKLVLIKEKKKGVY